MMGFPPYDALSAKEQVEVLRGVAREAADRFGVGVAGLELVLHEFNTTFRLDAEDGSAWALRVNTNSLSTPAHIRAQTAWQEAIAAQTRVSVPVPLRTPDGSAYAAVPCAAVGGQLRVTLASWLPGVVVDACTRTQARILGETMALLHEQALMWSVPPDGHLTQFIDPLFGDPDRLTAAVEGDARAAAVVAESLRRSAAAHGRVRRGGGVVVHADLHAGNLMWQGDRVAVFDFDDCGIAAPAVDLGVSAFYLRRGLSGSEEALFEGYARIRPLPELDGRDLEALLAGRQLLLANALLSSTTASWQQEARDYLGTAVDRLEGWLATGVFDFRAAGRQ